jgi:NADP-dependent 3-hydroxy acid dehydrogenase YdfG
MLIAFSQSNRPLAEAVSAQFAHLTPVLLDDAPQRPKGQFAEQILAHDGPCLLLLTDNLLRSEHALSGLLPALLILMRQERLLVVIADGVGEDGKPVETHIDRVVNAIQYMNHWQNVYLRRSDQHAHMPVDEQVMYSPELHSAHEVANQIGEIINTLRDSDPMTWEVASARGFDEVYGALCLPRPEPVEPPAAVQPEAPEEPTPSPTVPTAKTVVVGSGLMFKPAAPIEPPTLPVAPQIPDNQVITPKTEAQPVPSDIEAELNPISTPEIKIDTPNTVEATPSIEPEFVGQYPEDEIRRTIEDAWFWIERGNSELGLGVLEAAHEQYPHHSKLRQQYEFARAKYSDTALANIVSNEEPDEARSYDAAGDSAFEQSDYLMAKYCWDRASELAPNLSGIWRKLGLLTTDQLNGYQETSIHYLQKALEQDPNDDLVRARLIAVGTIQPAVSTQETSTEEKHDVETPHVPPPVVEETLTQPPPIREEYADVETPQPIVEATVQPTKIVMITGATSGIGRATAIEFARHGGYRLILTGRRAELLRELKSEIESTFHTPVLALVFDVRDYAATAHACSIIPPDWADIDILVNNAGLAKGLSPIQEGDLAHWEQMIDTNIKGLLYVTRCISPGMVERHSGHIINICSVAGKEVYPKGNVYCATKSAVDALTRSMRLDLHQYNIRVGQVSPGHVEETEFAITRFDGDAERAKIYNDFQPLTSRDVADAILYMATRPSHVNVQDMDLFGTQQASATVVDRSGRT